MSILERIIRGLSFYHISSTLIKLVVWYGRKLLWRSSTVIFINIYIFANIGIFSLLNFKEKSTYVFSSWESEIFRLEKIIFFLLSAQFSTTTYNIIIALKGIFSNRTLILNDSRIHLCLNFFLECFFSHVISMLFMWFPLSFFRSLLKCHFFLKDGITWQFSLKYPPI